MNFYGLLHIGDGRHSPNLKARGAWGAIRTYFANAVTLSHSLQAVGSDFVLLTNDAATLEAVNRDTLGADITIREIPFRAQVPKEIPFYSAHHKVDVYRWFATTSGGDYPVLVDLDVVALRPPSASFSICASSGIPLVYDISDQVFPAYGEDTIVSDLETLTGHGVPVYRWYGGEFIGGPPDFFARLVGEIDRLWGAYCRNFASFHHQGDEMLTSAALCRMIAAGCIALDAGPIGGVGRFWGGQPLHPQKPIAWFERCFLAHLPVDKSYLAAQAHRRPFRACVFLRGYRRHRMAADQAARVLGLVKRVVGKRRAASLARWATARCQGAGAMR